MAPPPLTASTARRLGWAAAIVVVVALAVGLRVSQTYATSWAGAQLVPYDTDPYYQLRRLELLRAGDFPPGVGERFVNAPARFDCPWPIGLPLLLDGIVGVATLGHAPTRHEVEAIAALAIPLLGALTPLLLMLVLSPMGRGVAWLGGLAAAALPSVRMAGHYARIDHHVLEPAAALALYALVFAVPRRARRSAIVGVVVGAAAALTLDLTFVFCIVLGGLAALFTLVGRPLATDRAAVLGLGGGMLAATLFELAVGAPRALGADLRIAIIVLFAAGVLASRAPGRGRALWLVVAAAAVYGLVRGVALGMWLAAPADPVTRTMEEALPGWSHGSAVQLAFHFVPVALGAGVLAVGLGDGRRRDLPLALFLVALTMLDVAQAKYQALRGLLEACGWALLPSLVALAIPAHLTLLRRVLRPAVAVALLAGSVLLLPPNPPLAQIPIARGLAAIAARVPELADPAYATPRAQPSSIALAHPVDAVRFGYLARVAVSALPFWSQPTSLAQYEATLALLRDPYGPALERRFADWRVRWVVVTKPRPQLGLYEQLRIGLGGDYPGWPATATLRLVVDAGTARLFERVRGATVRGRAAPDEAIAIDAAVQTATELQRFRVRGRADRDGRFAIVFPYASASRWPVAVRAIELRCGGRTRPLVIGDAAVESGGEVAADCAP